MVRRIGELCTVKMTEPIFVTILKKKYFLLRINFYSNFYILIFRQFGQVLTKATMHVLYNPGILVILNILTLFK